MIIDLHATFILTLLQSIRASGLSAVVFINKKRKNELAKNKFGPLFEIVFLDFYVFDSENQKQKNSFALWPLGGTQDEREVSGTAAQGQWCTRS